MGLEASDVHIYPDTEIGSALAEAHRLRAGLVVADSIQTVRVDGLAGAPGSISQVREATLQIMQFAKTTQTPVVLVGHVTKEGTVAGPRTLEHIVDTVLYLEGDDFHTQRLLRSVKNRFGPTFEVAVFEMRSDGLEEVPNPSELFLAERDARAPGSSVAVPLEGTRPLVVEIQALVAPTAYSLPKRLATGFDLNRLHMLLAVLGRRAGLRLGNHDVYVNVVGGLRLREPAVDLAVAIAIASSERDVATGIQVAAIGEIGLSGELRSVASAEQRVREARRLGFERCIVPAASTRNGSSDGIGAANLADALELALA
jgi:DNA repair protein RadA/Sms